MFLVGDVTVTKTWIASKLFMSVEICRFLCFIEYLCNFVNGRCWLRDYSE
jgi:hypothetical protein